MTTRPLTVVEDDTAAPVDFTVEQAAVLAAAGYGVVGFTTWDRILGLEAT